MTVSSMTDDLRSKYSIDKDIKGAVITEVANDGPPRRKAIEPGDVITEAGEQQVQGAADISARIDEATKANKNRFCCWWPRAAKPARCALSL